MESGESDSSDADSERDGYAIGSDGEDDPEVLLAVLEQVVAGESDNLNIKCCSVESRILVGNAAAESIKQAAQKAAQEAKQAEEVEAAAAVEQKLDQVFGFDADGPVRQHVKVPRAAKQRRLSETSQLSTVLAGLRKGNV
eukprot:gene13558-20189_t